MTKYNPQHPSPLEATLARDTVVNSNRLIVTRWGAAVLVGAATFVCVRLLRLPLPELPLYLLALFILAYNSALVRLTRSVCRDDALCLGCIQKLVILQVAFDWVSMAVFIHLTGGLTSPATPFFFLHVLMVTILLPGQSPYIYVALAVGVTLVIAALEASGILPHYTVIPGLPPDLHTNQTYVLAQIIFFATALFAAAYLTASVMARLRERERQIVALFQTTRDVSSTLNLTDVLERLARSAAEALNGLGASIRLLDESGDRLTVAASYGLSAAYFDKGVVDLSHNPLVREVLTKGPVIVREAAFDRRIQYPQKVVEEGIRGMLAVPIIGRDGPLGLLRVYADTPDYFIEDDIDFVVAIARQGSTAIENALAHDALQQADQDRAQFVRVVTHELRSPVAGAQSLLRVLLRDLAGTLTPQQYDIIARINRRMDALMDLINDLLAFAATKSVGRRDPLAAVPLQPALHRVIDKFTSQADEKHITLSFEAPDTPLSVRANEDGLARIFDNLIGNAVKYTPEGGSVNVQVAVGVPSTVSLVTISDTGIGIPADMLDRLGEEFFRAPNAKQAGITGTGLGVAIVKQLIDHFGGQMTVQSVEGEGTTFAVTLPLALSDET